MEPADRYSETRPARIAVFDFDGTLISGQSGALLSRYLLSRGYLSPSQVTRLGWWGIRYVLHLPKRQEEPREIIFSGFAGCGAAEVRAVMDDFYEKVLVKRLRPRAVEEVNRRLGDGCVTLLVSATFEDIAARAAEDMRFDGYVATEMRLDQDGRYTGEVEGEVVAGLGKRHAVERWADARFGRGRWIVDYAYGDHYSDCDLLVEAANPYAGSPGHTLKRTAQRLDWPIVDWK